MIIGVPTEVKDGEKRIALTSGAAEALVREGHRVLVQAGAGMGSGFSDDDYRQAGAEVVGTAAEAWGRADLVAKVKEPQPSEYDFLRPGLLLFTYLHLAAAESLTRELLARGVTGIAYETVQTENESLPLLIPMSEVAGRMAVQIGAHYLEQPQGGRGVLLGGVPGVREGSIVIIGGGTVGTSAALRALGTGARVTVIDINLERLRYLEQVLRGNLSTIASNRRNIAEAVRRAELVIGAVLIPGARAPHLVTEEMVASMAAGSVVVDVAVDQGGCIETIHPTSLSSPTYVVHGVVHYGVTNIPGSVPRTSTYALSNATLPYISRLAGLGFTDAVRSDAALAGGVNTHAGTVTHPAVAQAHGLPCRSVLERIA